MIIKNFTFKPGPVTINKVIVYANVRYWEDCEIDGQEFEEDTDPDTIKDLLGRYNKEYKIGLVDGDLLRLVINPETGKVENYDYTCGKEIRMHFKVCDECSWEITRRVHNGPNPDNWYDEAILSVENDYVPNFLAIDDSGYGDYIKITIQKDGFIKDWDSVLFAAWLEEESARINGRDDD
jgi:hypothetical protein